MDLDLLVQQLPVVIGDAVWRHLQKAKETSEVEVQLKGDLEIGLPSLSISFSLFHTFKGESNSQETENEKTIAEDSDVSKEKKDEAESENSSTADTENQQNVDEDQATKAQLKKSSLKKLQKKTPARKRARTPSEASGASDESDVNLSDDDEADPSSDVEFSVPVPHDTPARISRRLKIKAETLGRHDFSRGIKRFKNLKNTNSKQGRGTPPETPISLKNAAKKIKASSGGAGEGEQGPLTGKGKSKAAESDDAIVAKEVPFKKRRRGRPKKSETVTLANVSNVTVKEEPGSPKERESTNNIEEQNVQDKDKEGIAISDDVPGSDVPGSDVPGSDVAGSDVEIIKHEGQEKEAEEGELAKVFECDLCEKAFDRKSSLKEHKFIHSRESEFVCDECDKPFSRWYKLKMHKILKHGASATKGNLPERMRKAPRTAEAIRRKGNVDNRPRPFPCDICGKGFTSRGRMQEHKFLHKEDTRFFCNICFRRYYSFSKLERHLKEMHGQTVDADMYAKLIDEVMPPEGCSVVIKDKGETLTVRCNLCSDFEGTREGAVEHLEIHADMFASACEYCDKRFLYIPALKTHQNFIHLHEFRHECVVCQNKFARMEDLALHAKKEHDVIMEVPAPLKTARKCTSKTAYKCPNCDQTFQKKKRLNDHIWVKHDKKEKPYKCALCPRRFIREDILKDHMFVHDRKSRYVCETCGKIFKKRFELLQHRHLDDPWRCSICDKIFMTYNGYKLHMRKHTEVPSHMCRFCGAMFFFKGRLENHERSHTGEKPFVCSVCNARFGDSYVYNKHVKSHTIPDDAKHVCTTCNRKFLYPAQLRSHLQVHSAPRQKYPCNLCHKSYLKKESLRQHMRVAHEDAEQEAQLYYQCEVCNLLYTNAADCEKCKNNHYQTANAVAEGSLTEDGNVAVDGLVENAVVTQVDDNTQVLVVRLEDLEHIGHQFVIEQQDDGSHETVQHLILNPEQAIEIAPIKNTEIENSGELIEHSAKEILEEASQELLEQPTEEFIEESGQELITEQEHLIEQPGEVLIEQAIPEQS